MTFLNKFLRTVPVSLALLAGSFSATAMVAGDGEEVNPQILILGDSLSAAYNMEIGDAWPSLLQARLEQDGYAWRVFNSSISGDTTQGGLARLPRLLDRTQPSIVIIELGGNDGLRGISPEVTRQNLAGMIEMSQARGARVVLTGIRIPPNYGATYIEAFEGIFPSLAETYGTGLVPFFMEGVALQEGMMQADGVHPSVEAQAILLDNLWPVLEPMLSLGTSSP